MPNPFLGDSVPFIILGWAWLAWAVPAAATLLGGILGNKSSAKEAQLNRDFQEGMSRTQHQREVTDLRAAGLNPILSGTGGSGAGMPAGATAQQRNPAAGMAQDTIASAKLARQNVKTGKSQEGLNVQTTDTSKATAANQRKQVQVGEATRQLVDAQTAKTNSEGATAREVAYMTGLQRILTDLEWQGSKHGANLHSSAGANKVREAELLRRGVDAINPLTLGGSRGRGGYSEGRKSGGKVGGKYRHTWTGGSKRITDTRPGKR